MLLSYRGAELIGRLALSSGRGFEFTSEGALKKVGEDLCFSKQLCPNAWSRFTGLVVYAW